jgi:hypothetical protein
LRCARLPLDGSSAADRWRCGSNASSQGKEITFVGSMVPTYSGRPWRRLARNQKIPGRFNTAKPQTPPNGAYLFWHRAEFYLTNT